MSGKDEKTARKPRARKQTPAPNPVGQLVQLTASLTQLKLDKQARGAFYSTKANYILQQITIPPTVNHIIEPFAGSGDLVVWARNAQQYKDRIDAYDIQPNPAAKCEKITVRDTLLNPPDYANAWVLTNPPYLARNKTGNKVVFDRWNTNDLFKCFLLSLCGGPPRAQASPVPSTTSSSSPSSSVSPTPAPVVPTTTPVLCAGGALILPATFFLSPRTVDQTCRHEFMTRFRILSVTYFEEQTFPDTTITVVAIKFERSTEPLSSQVVPWTRMPGKETKQFIMSAENGWIVGGDIYTLTPPVERADLTRVQIRRQVTGTPMKPNEHLTRMQLRAMDSGKEDGRICLEFKDADYVYESKDTSRSYAMLTTTNLTLTPAQQEELCTRFNAFIEQKRGETWSLFLPQFRESKEYARKRIPFDLAYRVVLYLLGTSRSAPRLRVETPDELEFRVRMEASQKHRQK